MTDPKRPDVDAIADRAEQLRLDVLTLRAYNRSQHRCIEKLEAEIRGWRDCIIIDAQMDGPKFMGVKRDQARRMWEQISKPSRALR